MQELTREEREMYFSSAAALLGSSGFELGRGNDGFRNGLVLQSCESRLSDVMSSEVTPGSSYSMSIKYRAGHLRGQYPPVPAWSLSTSYPPWISCSCGCLKKTLKFVFLTQIS